MGDYSVNDAMSKLGIYKSEASALDALDGKKDGKISKDIFSKAEETLKNAEALYSEDNDGESIDLSKWSDVAKSMARTITQRIGLSGFVYSNNKNENIGEQIDNDEHGPAHKQMAEMAEQAADYIAEHKTLDGFKFTGVPKGITNIRINVDEYFGDGENDIVSFDSEGKAVIEKVVDGISIEIHYTYNGTDYAFGGNIINEDKQSADGASTTEYGANTPPQTPEASGEAVAEISDGNADGKPGVADENNAPEKGPDESETPSQQRFEDENKINDAASKTDKTDKTDKDTKPEK